MSEFVGYDKDDKEVYVGDYVAYGEKVCRITGIREVYLQRVYINSITDTGEFFAWTFPLFTGHGGYGMRLVKEGFRSPYQHYLNYLTKGLPCNL
jgi:hypothetical protein